ncbi:hypothetical protein JW879_03275 [candidate division WOR-3 bacterium]|nr:hypothetical protein [candidate division WOR-3 bacterium]
MYEKCYYNSHKLLSANLKSGYIREIQKGFYDQIICPGCESESQIYDRYASLILYQKKSSVYKKIKRKTNKKNMNGIILNYSFWENIDFLKFQKFVFACVLRMHLSERKRKKSLFSEKHFKIMRKIYKSDTIIDDEIYPIIVKKSPDDDEYLNRVVLPYQRKIRGHNVIEFYGAGYTFWVFVSNHKKPDFVELLCLKKKGDLYLSINYFEDTGTFKALLNSNFKKDFKKYRDKKGR